MKNYLNFETDIKNLEAEIEKLKDPYNQDGLSEVDTEKISNTQAELDEKLKIFTQILILGKRQWLLDMKTGQNPNFLLIIYLMILFLYLEIDFMVRINQF